MRVASCVLQLHQLPRCGHQLVHRSHTLAPLEVLIHECLIVFDNERRRTVVRIGRPVPPTPGAPPVRPGQLCGPPQALTCLIHSIQTPWSASDGAGPRVPSLVREYAFGLSDTKHGVVDTQLLKQKAWLDLAAACLNIQKRIEGL